MKPTESYPISSFTLATNGDISFNKWIAKIVNNSKDTNNIGSTKKYIEDILANKDCIIDFLFFYLKKQTRLMDNNNFGMLEISDKEVNRGVLCEFILNYNIFKNGPIQDAVAELNTLTPVLDKLDVPDLTPQEVRQAQEVERKNQEYQKNDTNIRKLADLARVAREKANHLSKEARELVSSDQYWDFDYHNQEEGQKIMKELYKKAAEDAALEAKAAEAALKAAEEANNTGFGKVVKVVRKIRKKYTISARRRSRRKITRKRSNQIEIELFLKIVTAGKIKSSI